MVHAQNFFEVKCLALSGCLDGECYFGFNFSGQSTHVATVENYGKIVRPTSYAKILGQAEASTVGTDTAAATL